MPLSTGGRQEAREAPGSGQTLRNHHPGTDVMKLFSLPLTLSKLRLLSISQSLLS
jgi:hypothetical protein